MIRAIGFLIVLAGLSALSVWFADNPGQVSLVWQGYVIETSAAVLVMGIVMIAIAAAVLYRLWVALKQAPGKIARNRRDAKTRRGYQALTRGIVAVAAGDAVEAKAQAG
ncbi:MAG: heme biosynthesis protein HemY, partial [Rhodospirillaceae bacterium]|nr:heme biosynthesis protein HemY [Rhodospirillaceae bacterium]